VSKLIKRFLIVGVIAVLFTLAFAACDRSTGSPGKDAAVAATVNGKAIPLSEVDNIITQQSKGQQAQLSPLEQAAARLQVLDKLIQQEALFQRAEKEKTLPSEDEITTFINNQKQQSHMSEEDFQRNLREANQTEQSLREQVKKELAIQKLQDKINSKITVPTDKEVEDFYNANKKLFVRNAGVGLSAIIIDPRDNGLQDDAKSDAEAAAKAQRISAQLKSGGDFATIARAASEDPSSAQQGGDIGFWDEAKLKQSGFPSELTGRLLNSIPVGNSTEPIKTGDGRIMILKVTSRQPKPENLTLDSPGVREQIKDAILNQRRALVNAALLETAMNEAKVVNNLADSMINDPNTINNLRYAAPANAAATPAASTSPAASPSANAAANKK
jgi:parvulin-like peptidyl-prolyl isomerase